MLVQIKGQLGQVCGLNEAMDTNQSVLTTVNAAALAVTRSWYQYKWAAGNNRPSQYASLPYGSQVVETPTNSWVGVPMLKAVQDAAGTYNENTFGAWDFHTRHSTNINPAWNCDANFIPNVDTDPP